MRKGEVTSVDPIKRTARVTFRDTGTVVTAEIPIARGLAVNVGDQVAVAIFSQSLADGLIIAVF